MRNPTTSRFGSKAEDIFECTCPEQLEAKWATFQRKLETQLMTKESLDKKSCRPGYAGGQSYGHRCGAINEKN
ncbi:hypothetical protein CEXT_456661 [Caerostris extrusa]|uniref:Uncharacterized protein n=1 Tax=Caerostris extrusa TaxID=172846 RepID=A0AAV4YCR2_CAEEX|nr:hypothetical protein CEXT_456661 [Caerostris extrusa]